MEMARAPNLYLYRVLRSLFHHRAHRYRDIFCLSLPPLLLLLLMLLLMLMLMVLPLLLLLLVLPPLSSHLLPSPLLVPPLLPLVLYRH